MKNVQFISLVLALLTKYKLFITLINFVFYYEVKMYTNKSENFVIFLLIKSQTVFTSNKKWSKINNIKNILYTNKLISF